MNTAPFVGAQARLPAAVSRGAAVFPKSKVAVWILADIRSRHKESPALREEPGLDCLPGKGFMDWPLGLACKQQGLILLFMFLSADSRDCVLRPRALLSTQTSRDLDGDALLLVYNQ